MTVPSPESLVADARRWWSTSIVDIEPGKIAIRGYPIEELIGTLSYPQMVWLMLRGELPEPAQARLLEAAMVAAVDHGPHAPSIAISRMATTCGLPINGAMASAINALDGIHGGAGQQCMSLMYAIAAASADGPDKATTSGAADRVEQVLDAYVAEHGKIVPGFGHRWHDVDPRAVRQLALVVRSRQAGVVDGRFAAIGSRIEQLLGARKGVPIPMNIDGATAVIYCELGFEPALGRGLFILSRSVGILAHAWEQTQQGGRIKGPLPTAFGYSYTGPARRHPPSPDNIAPAATDGPVTN
jgi:citrate synthase